MNYVEPVVPPMTISAAIETGGKASASGGPRPPSLNTGSSLHRQVWKKAATPGTEFPGWSFLGGSNSNWAANAEKFEIRSDTKPFETPFMFEARATSTEVASLSAQMRQLESRTQVEIRTLSDKVEMLTRALEATVRVPSDHAEAELPQFMSVTVESLSAAREAGTLADALNQIADEVVTAPVELSSIARTAISNPDPAVRAAAGRAMSVADPTMALSVLPEAIRIEKNRFVLSILKGAMRAASA